MSYNGNHSKQEYAILKKFVLDAVGEELNNEVKNENKKIHINDADLVATPNAILNFIYKNSAYFNEKKDLLKKMDDLENKRQLFPDAVVALMNNVQQKLEAGYFAENEIADVEKIQVLLANTLDEIERIKEKEELER